LIKARRGRRARPLGAARGAVLGRRGHSLLPDPESQGNHAHQPAKSASHRPDHTAPRQVPVEPSPDARECAPSHRRRPGAARSFRPPPHLSTGPFHSRPSRKHLAADPWTPPPSRLVSASITVRGGMAGPALSQRTARPCSGACCHSLRQGSKGIALTASSRTWSGPRRRERSASKSDRIPKLTVPAELGPGI
jgi:hypothetical protein